MSERKDTWHRRGVGITAHYPSWLSFSSTFSAPCLPLCLTSHSPLDLVHRSLIQRVGGGSRSLCEGARTLDIEAQVFPHVALRAHYFQGGRFAVVLLAVAVVQVCFIDGSVSRWICSVAFLLVGMRR